MKCVLCPYRQYIYDPDPELLSLFKNFEVKETDEVSNGDAIVLVPIII